MGVGMPADRRACLAALQAFRDLKRTYLHVLQDTVGGDWLCQLVRQADEPMDLWQLRAPAFALLEGVDSEHRSRRQLLRRGLDTLFPEREAQAAAALG